MKSGHISIIVLLRGRIKYFHYSIVEGAYKVRNENLISLYNNDISIKRIFHK